MATIEERTKELDELYAKATTQEEYHRIWKAAQEVEKEARAQNLPINVRVRAALNGFWARYYEVRKFARTRENIDELYGLVKQATTWIGKEDVELAVNCRYLLSVIIGQLKEDLEEAGRIDEELRQLVKDTGNVPLALRVINAQGLNAMQRKDWQEAIAIFTSAEQNFPEASNVPEARQHLGNTVNNRGLSKLNLSNEMEDLEQKKEMVRSGVQDLLAAMNLYFRVPLIPQKHLEGIRNRLRVAKDKAKEVDPDLVRAIEIFVQ